MVSLGLFWFSVSFCRSFTKLNFSRNFFFVNFQVYWYKSIYILLLNLLRTLITCSHLILPIVLLGMLVRHFNPILQLRKLRLRKVNLPTIKKLQSTESRLCLWCTDCPFCAVFYDIALTPSHQLYFQSLIFMISNLMLH